MSPWMWMVKQADVGDILVFRTGWPWIKTGVDRWECMSDPPSRSATVQVYTDLYVGSRLINPDRPGHEWWIL